ncbi:MAG TPA: glutamate--tRNA ligase [Acidimicrobiales bacterium]|jgi:glutamyl-tRNA synthetase
MPDLSTPPRVRFAPSPTGYFHVGSARSALFNWLFARQHGGTFVLRIEDTDEQRNRPEWTEGIISALDWLGMAPDEGPYLQSAQGEAHQAAIELLWSAGALYACGCTREEIDARAKVRAEAGDPTPGYDGHCRDLGLPRGEGRALRFRTPDEGITVVHDLIRGEVEFPNRATEDFICVKGNGQPLFALANVVDDRTMAISHVFRGEEHLSNTPKQIMLWQALDAASGSALPLPVYAHLPLLVNEQGKKLSKRRDPVAVEMYREQGFLPQAFRNYLALLGWSPGNDEEILPLEELIQRFRIEDVQRSPAFFDLKKLTHINGVYIRELTVDDFITLSMPWVNPIAGEWAPGRWHDPDTETSGPAGPPWSPDRFDEGVYVQMAPFVQERVAIMSEIVPMVDFFFLPEVPIDQKEWERSLVKDEAGSKIVQAALDAYADCAWEHLEIKRVTEVIAESFDLKVGKAQAPIRAAITGKRNGPPLFESLEVLGREETRRRLDQALARLAEG